MNQPQWRRWWVVAWVTMNHYGKQKYQEYLLVFIAIFPGTWWNMCLVLDSALCSQTTQQGVRGGHVLAVNVQCSHAGCNKRRHVLQPNFGKEASPMFFAYLLLYLQQHKLEKDMMWTMLRRGLPGCPQSEALSLTLSLLWGWSAFGSGVAMDWQGVSCMLSLSKAGCNPSLLLAPMYCVHLLFRIAWAGCEITFSLILLRKLRS